LDGAKLWLNWQQIRICMQRGRYQMLSHLGKVPFYGGRLEWCWVPEARLGTQPTGKSKFLSIWKILGLLHKHGNECCYLLASDTSLTMMNSQSLASSKSHLLVMLVLAWIFGLLDLVKCSMEELCLITSYWRWLETVCQSFCAPCLMVMDYGMVKPLHVVLWAC
jgi:hypothetical protein